jgi:hypothetical protein
VGLVRGRGRPRDSRSGDRRYKSGGELLTPSVTEVEFIDDQGRTYAMAALRSEQLIRLHRQPCERVA